MILTGTSLVIGALGLYRDANRTGSLPFGQAVGTSTPPNVLLIIIADAWANPNCSPTRATLMTRRQA